MNPFDELEARIAALEARADTASAIRATILLTLGEMNKTIRVLLQRDIEATMPPAAEGEKAEARALGNRQGKSMFGDPWTG